MELTPELLGQKLGEWLDSQGMTADGLRGAIAAGRPLVQEAVAGMPWLARSVVKANRERMLRWGQDELTRVLQQLAATHPAHAALLHAAWHAYWLPQVRAAMDAIRAM